MLGRHPPAPTGPSSTTTRVKYFPKILKVTHAKTESTPHRVHSRTNLKLIQIPTYLLLAGSNLALLSPHAFLVGPASLLHQPRPPFQPSVSRLPLPLLYLRSVSNSAPGEQHALDSRGGWPCLVLLSTATRGACENLKHRGRGSRHLFAWAYACARRFYFFLFFCRQGNRGRLDKPWTERISSPSNPLPADIQASTSSLCSLGRGPGACFKKKGQHI